MASRIRCRPLSYIDLQQPSQFLGSGTVSVKPGPLSMAARKCAPHVEPTIRGPPRPSGSNFRSIELAYVQVSTSTTQSNRMTPDIAPTSLRPVSCLTIPHQHNKVQARLERGLRGRHEKSCWLTVLHVGPA